MLKKDLKYWKEFFNKRNIPNYVNKGSTIGEYVILMPVGRIGAIDKNGLKVEPLSRALAIARENEMYLYAYNYMRDKYGSASA